MGITALLIPLIHSPTFFLAAGAIYGSAFGLIPVTFATLITELAPRDKYIAAMGVYNSAIDFGLFIGPLMGGVAAIFRDIAPFFLALPLALIAIIMTPNSTEARPHGEGYR